MALPASDNFTGTNGDSLPTYSSNWSLVGVNLTIFNNGCNSNSTPGTDCANRWNADSFPNDQYSQLVAVDVTSGVYIGVAARMKTDDSLNYYGYYIDSAGGFMFKVIAGTGTQLGNTDGAGADGDTLKITAVGTTISPFKNGALNTTIGAVTDSALASGSAGVVGNGTSTSALGDSWLADGISAGVALAGQTLLLLGVGR